MALLINADCTACDACVEPCPNDAITVGDPVHVIDALRCTECVGTHDEAQCKLVCPADCIVEHHDFRETPEELVAKYESLHGWAVHAGDRRLLGCCAQPRPAAHPGARGRGRGPGSTIGPVDPTRTPPASSLPPPVVTAA